MSRGTNVYLDTVRPIALAKLDGVIRAVKSRLRIRKW